MQSITRSALAFEWYTNLTMIPAACKRLAEVDFPIAEVSRGTRRGRSRYGTGILYDVASVVGAATVWRRRGRC